ncbi:MAG: ribbon-helix-helix domain-containing protein [Methanomassiliicoccaceae archaeon]|nr:ribbon-helix-helix domain-containing protein [Methanomassiliicoccaceae archaeon]
MTTISDKSVSVRFPPAMIEKMERAIDSGGYSHFSELIREAVREKLDGM